MPGALVNMGYKLTCAHGGNVLLAPPAPRVMVGGQPAVFFPNQPVPIPDCKNMTPAPFNIPTPAGPVPGTPAKAPCINATLNPALKTMRVTSMGMPLVHDGLGLPGSVTPAVFTIIPIPPATIPTGPPIPAPLLPFSKNGQAPVKVFVT
jgi:hypothetical protein